MKLIRTNKRYLNINHLYKIMSIKVQVNKYIYLQIVMYYLYLYIFKTLL